MTLRPLTSPSAIPARRLLLLVMGFVIWAIAFVALYAVNAIGCEFGWPAPVQRAVLALLYGAHVLVLAGVLRWTLKRRARAKQADEPVPLLEDLGVGLSAAALVAALLSLLPALTTTMCVAGIAR